MARYKYHRSLSFDYIDPETKEVIHQTLITQLYEVGIYGIWNNNPATQGGFEPKDLVKWMKQIKKDEKEGVIKNLILGAEITVDDASGMWKQV